MRCDLHNDNERITKPSLGLLVPPSLLNEPILFGLSSHLRLGRERIGFHRRRSLARLLVDIVFSILGETSRGGGVHLRVVAACSHQLVVSSMLDQRTVQHYEDLVGEGHTGEAMSDVENSGGLSVGLMSQIWIPSEVKQAYLDRQI